GTKLALNHRIELKKGRIKSEIRPFPVDRPIYLKPILFHHKGRIDRLREQVGIDLQDVLRTVRLIRRWGQENIVGPQERVVGECGWEAPRELHRYITPDPAG